MQNETEPIDLGTAFIFEDHAAICVLRSLVCILTADEGEANGASVIFGWSCACSSDAASVAGAVGEAIPVFGRGLETSDEDTAGPVGRGGYLGVGLGDDVIELGVSSKFDGERVGGSLIAGLSPRPKQNAVMVGVAGCDTLGEERTVFVPGHA